MQFAILGAGNIGRTLGVKWLAAGHTLHFGVRDPASFEWPANGRPFSAWARACQAGRSGLDGS